ncbi:UDP-N-acetylmuramate dehydrogenase [Candidatus Nomurabacteria bacterium]|nr:UDP-N-acetylmuramate dehydrogenase [Candidatus Nomurabacteria bacterium]
MLQVQENVDIKDYCTIHIGGQFRYFAIIKTKEEITEAIEFARKNNTRLFMLGGGSNIVFTDKVLDVLALKIEIEGFEIIENTDDYAVIKVGAGENWDIFVSRTVVSNLSGLEALSAIPGTVGATPVQNVGAYGQEVKDTIVSIEVFDIQNKVIKTLTNTECKFAYRDSIFKHEDKNKYIILTVTFKLSKKNPEIPHYIDVKKYFIQNNINTPTLLEIRNAIIHIRGYKLPDPKVIFNVGSFFKNPIVSSDVAKKLKNNNPELTIYPIDEDHTKVPAGWLIEKAGLKGKNFGPLSLYNKNALVLVNNGNATYEDIISVRDQIIKTVFDKFGITLEQEPEIIK